MNSSDQILLLPPQDINRDVSGMVVFDHNKEIMMITANSQRIDGKIVISELPNSLNVFLFNQH